jgi:hypothetical protein
MSCHLKFLKDVISNTLLVCLIKQNKTLTVKNGPSPFHLKGRESWFPYHPPRCNNIVFSFIIIVVMLSPSLLLTPYSILSLLASYWGCLPSDGTIPNSGVTVYIIIFSFFHIF